MPAKVTKRQTSLVTRLTPHQSDAIISQIRSWVDTLESSPKTEYLKAQMLSKYLDPRNAVSANERKVRAIHKWLKTEVNNHETNLRLASAHHMTRFIIGHVPADRFFEKLRSVVLSIIGPLPAMSEFYFGFSGGATTSKRRSEGHPSVKFRDEAHVTLSAVHIWAAVFDGSQWMDHCLTRGIPVKVVKGNMLFTVPKNTEIDRVAAKEPDLNVFLQKGVGNWIRARLLKAGVNLNDQRVNQNLAKVGSTDGSLATIDLSSASDSMSLELVRAVLPPEWFSLMNALRCAYTYIDEMDMWHQNRMFSSMGNGFTFELESLIFLALSRTVAYFTGVKGDISVYGDDIIVPSSMASQLIEALSFCGFTTNRSKTFIDGPIRESCGAHWHQGVDITPFYIRGPLRDTTDVIHLWNTLVKWSLVGDIPDPRLAELRLLELIPQAVWGGFDYSSRFAAVTDHSPRMKLVPKRKIRRLDDMGGYLNWLYTSSYVRDLQVSLVTETLNEFRLRANRKPR